MVDLSHKLVLSEILPEGYSVDEVVLRQEVVLPDHRISVAGGASSDPCDEEASQEDQG